MSWLRRRGSGPARSPQVGVGAVDGFEVLEKVAALPISTWRYRWEKPPVRHLGPMAQDFKAGFGLGDSDRVINMLDGNGVALVSIQALYRLVGDLQAELAQLRAQTGVATAGEASAAQPAHTANSPRES